MYRVEWLMSAFDELGEIWLRADSALRAAITSSIHVMERALADHAPVAGESRGDGNRIFIESPLGMTFRVDDNNRMAIVLRIWLIRRHV